MIISACCETRSRDTIFDSTAQKVSVYRQRLRCERTRIVLHLGVSKIFTHVHSTHEDPLREQQDVLIILSIFFGALPAWHITPGGAAFFRAYGHSHERRSSLPVSVLFRVGSAEKTNQEVTDGNRTRLAGSVVQRLRPFGLGDHFKYEEK